MAVLAIVAAIAGGPLGMCLALAYGVVAYTKLNKVDAQYAARGEMTPGTRLIEKWLEGRKARGKAPADAKPAKYGMWRYFWQRWRAMWEVLAEGHRIQHEQYLKKRAEALRNGTSKPKRPSWKEQAQAAWQWTIDVLGKPVGDTKPSQKPEPTAAAPRAAVSSLAGSDPTFTCDLCGADTDAAWTHPPESTCPRAVSAAQAGAPSRPVCRFCGLATLMSHTPDETLPATCMNCGRVNGRRSSTEFHWSCDTCGAWAGGYPTRQAAADGGQAHADRRHASGTVEQRLPDHLPPRGSEEDLLADGPDTSSQADDGELSPVATAPTAERACKTCGAPQIYKDDECQTCHRYTYYNNALADGNVHTINEDGTETPVPPDQQIPNPMKNDQAQGDDMTATTIQQQSGEVTGLMSAINYAETVAAAHGQHSAGSGEQYLASLGTAEVGAETIASAARAQEASAIAQSAWTVHSDKLREQLAAKEVTTTETGKKDFLLTE